VTPYRPEYRPDAVAGLTTAGARHPSIAAQYCASIIADTSIVWMFSTARQ
jgi:hypothetical protein